METPKKFFNVSAAELLDRLTISQIKEILDRKNVVSHEEELIKIEEALDSFFQHNPIYLSAYFIRLVVALAQINLHIWRTKEFMSREGQFNENMKLAHQLNGVRNQLKNLLSQETNPRQVEKKTNIQTENLTDWRMSILEGKGYSKKSLERLSDKNNEFSDSGSYYPTLTDLIDDVTISQIKEAIFKGDDRLIYKNKLSELDHDIDAVLGNKIKVSTRLIRLITFLAQANLCVWYNKERMQQEPKKYYELLEWAQDLNSLRNYVRNLLMEEFKEASPAQKRAIFFGSKNEEWYSSIIDLITGKGSSKSEKNILMLDSENFAEIFGIKINELPPDSLKIIREKDFRYEKVNSLSRDKVILSILKRINTGDFWVSGKDKKDVWEKGWSENLETYEKTKNINDLTPKFLKPNQVLRLNGEYIKPADQNFEFNFVDVYRRWAFQTFLKDVEKIYEFGCGSCQHLITLKKIFKDKELHGLDWAPVSVEIIKKLNKVNSWNIKGRVFDMLKPDERVDLGYASGVLTVGTMEQLGKNFEPFLKFLLTKKPRVVVHFETIREFYNDSDLADYLAILYDEARNYLRGYFDYLKQLEDEGKISIIRARHISFGSMYHDSYSLVVWKPT